MPSFIFDLRYQSLFHPYMTPPQAMSMQNYFEFIAQSIYHLNLNQ
jgi:hypothetical protein